MFGKKKIQALDVLFESLEMNSSNNYKGAAHGCTSVFRRIQPLGDRRCMNEESAYVYQIGAY